MLSVSKEFVNLSVLLLSPLLQGVEFLVVALLLLLHHVLP